MKIDTESSILSFTCFKQNISIVLSYLGMVSDSMYITTCDLQITLTLNVINHTDVFMKVFHFITQVA